MKKKISKEKVISLIIFLIIGFTLSFGIFSSEKFMFSEKIAWIVTPVFFLSFMTVPVGAAVLYETLKVWDYYWEMIGVMLFGLVVFSMIPELIAYAFFRYGHTIVSGIILGLWLFALGIVVSGLILWQIFFVKNPGDDRDWGTKVRMYFQSFNPINS